MAQTFTVSGNAKLPLEDSQATAPIDLGVSFPYTAKADFSRKYDAAVTDDPVDLGTLSIPGAKGIIIKCIAGSCTIKFNGGNTAWPLSAAGGPFFWANSSQGFVNAATISTTGAATVIFIAVG